MTEQGGPSGAALLCFSDGGFMKLIRGLQKPVVACMLCAVVLLPAIGHAQEDPIVGNRFKVFIYSDSVDDASMTITFNSNLTLLIDAYDGFGVYVPMGTMFAGAFWAPNFYETEDLVLLTTGVVVSDFLSGMGIAFRDQEFYELFFFSGYAD